MGQASADSGFLLCEADRKKKALITLGYSILFILYPKAGTQRNNTKYDSPYIYIYIYRI